MPTLKCSVVDCQHNSQACCCLGHIDVGGTNAKECASTCCESFDCKGNSMMGAACQQPKADAAIDCHAENCVYNQNCKCHADVVCVDGSNCTSCGETNCATFHCR